MSTFAQPANLHDRITYAYAVLQKARYDGVPETIYVARRRFEDLLERLPAGRPLADIDQALDAHLRVAMK